MISLGTAMALVRGLHLAATLSLLGTAGFVAWMLPAAGIVPDLARRGLIRLWWISGLVALMAGLGWFTVQSAMIAGAGSWSDLAAALPVVAGHTRFGNILMVRLGLLVAATALAVVRSSVPGPTQGRSSVPGPTQGRSSVPGPTQGRSLAPGSAQGRSLAPGSAQGRPPGVTVAARAGRGALARPDTPGDGQTAGPSGDERAPSGRDERGQPDRLTLYLALVLSIAAVGLQGLIGHAGATEGAIGDGLVLSELLHLLAAGIWLGALLPLWLSTSALAPAQAVAVCERFSPIGLACVLVLAGTGFAQGVQLIGGLPALFGTRYGHIALLKIALFLLALGLAAVNRLWLTDRLAAGAAGARRHLRVSVSIETVVGLAIVGAAAFMASSPPAAHTTPVWPFSWRFSLTTVNEDADFRREVTISLVVIGAAIALMGAALLGRRLRLVALAVLVLALVLCGPSLTLLTVEAYPTSFQTSPTNFSAASIARGRAVFAENCVACHGPEAEGDGPAAAALRIKPADLTMPHLWEHTDGEMFWWLSHGVDDPEGGMAMPGFANVLSAEDRWAVIDFVRAHNAGLAMRRDTTFDVPISAPTFPVTCRDAAVSTMAELRGHAVHVVAGEAAAPPQSGPSIITLALRDKASPGPGACVAATPAAWDAYAVLAGLPSDKLAGAEFLVDPNGWLRAVHRPDAPGGWHTTDDLIAAVRGIDANPIQQLSGGSHEHHH